MLNEFQNTVRLRQEDLLPTGDFFRETNKAIVSGIIEEEFQMNHETMWERFFRTRLIVERYSGEVDYVPIIVSEVLINQKAPGKILKGCWVEVRGQFRSYNKIGEDGKSHLDLFLFATDFNVYQYKEELVLRANNNMIYLEGFLCKPPVYRVTYSGRQITDLHLAVNRAYKKSDYIPCIAWGRFAQLGSKLEVGSKVKLYGRIQSRLYFKRYSPESEEGEYKEAYEISIMRMQRAEEF